MSLDIYFKKRKTTTGCYRTNGDEISTEEMLKAFPDYEVEFDEVWWRNITHNVGYRIAGKVPVQKDVEIDNDNDDKASSLYQILWHPTPQMFNKKEWNEVQPADYIEYLKYAINYMTKNMEYLSKFNAENGWGTANGLLLYIEDMIKACEQYPEVDKICVSI